MGLLARSLRVEKRTLLGSLHTIAPALWDQLHLTSVAGPVITENVALKSTVVLSCVRVIAETLASLPAHVYARIPGGKRQAPEHPVFRLMHDQPNPLMTAYTFKETLEAHLCLWGNAYAEIVRDGNGVPVELWPVPPARMISIQRTPGEYPDLLYTIALIDGGSVTLSSRDVLHIPGLSYDGFLGKSPIRLAAEAIGLSLATEEFTARFFSNGAQTSGYLSHPGVLSDPARENLRKSIEERYGGLTNAWRIMLLEEGTKWEQTGMKLVDAQLLELRKFQIADIARIFRVPLHLVGETEKATSWGTGIEQFGAAFVMYCLRPWAIRWEQAVHNKLFLPSEQTTRFLEFSFDSLLRGDLASRYAAYAVARQWGWLNADEIRESENLNPIGGDAGQSYLNPLNFSPAGTTTPAPDVQPTDTPSSRADYRPLLDAAWERVTRRAADEVAAAIKRLAKDGEEPSVRDAMAGWMREHQGYIEAQLAPIVAAGWRPGDNGHA